MPTLPLKDNNNDSPSKSRDEVELESLRTTQQLTQSLQSYSQAYIQSQQESRQDFIQAFQRMTDAIIRPTNQSSANTLLGALTPSTSQSRLRPSRALEFHSEPLPKPATPYQPRATTWQTPEDQSEALESHGKALRPVPPIDAYSIVRYRITTQASYAMSAEGNNMANTRRPVGSSWVPYRTAAQAYSTTTSSQS
ncbi:MAG: hypothetical protein Q9204_000146 [Flavoplaca sp. TL-2023a]